VRELQIELQAIRPTCAPEELRRPLWQRIEDTILGHCRKPSNGITRVYLAGERSDGLAGQWAATTTGISLRFRDGGVYVMSCEAAAHWVELVLASGAREVIGECERRGYRLVPPRRSLDDLLRTGPDYPLVHLPRLCAVTRRVPGQPIPDDAVFTDGLQPTVERDRMPDTQLAMVEWAALTGQCACDVCAGLRREHPIAARGSPARHLAAVQRAWEILDDDPAARELEAGVAGELVADPSRRPASLAVLRDRLEDGGAVPPEGALVSLIVSRARARARTR
jgi:hypothetical protein